MQFRTDVYQLGVRTLVTLHCRVLRVDAPPAFISLGYAALGLLHPSIADFCRDERSNSPEAVRRGPLSRAVPFTLISPAGWCVARAVSGSTPDRVV
jgi:hypothetical protein